MNFDTLSKYLASKTGNIPKATLNTVLSMN